MTSEETHHCDCTVEVTETEEGFRVELKGDKTEAHTAGCCCPSRGYGFPPAFAHAFWRHAGHHPMRGHHHGGPMGGCCG